MINQIRADFYRLSHGWGIYLTLIFTVIYSAIINVQQIVGGIMVTGDSMSRLNSSGTWTLNDGIHASTLSSSVLIYVFISIFVITIGYEFSQKTYKNTLVSGITRSQFVISKYLIMLLNIFVLIVVYFGTSIISGLLSNRKVGVGWQELLTTTLNTSLVIAFFISVTFGIAILVLISTLSIVMSSLFIVIFPMIVSIINNLVNWGWLKYFDFFSVAIKISLRIIPNNQLWNYMLVSVFVLIVTVGLSIIFIRNKEL